jgi:hypothetical protein
MSFADCNERFIAALIDRRAEIRTALRKQSAQLLADGGHLLRLLPVNFLFDEDEAAELSRAALALIDIQTKIIRDLIGRHGRSGFLDIFDVPRSMRRFVNWDELQNPRHLIGRVDILAGRGRYYFCELNIDSCVAGAEIFDFCDAYFREIGLDIRRKSGAVPPLADLASLLAQRAAELDVDRIVILDWSVGGGSPGKGYLSFDRMKDYLAREIPSMPIYLTDERGFDPAWLTPREAARTLVHRGFMMSEMDDGGAFLDRLLGAGAHVIGTYETEIRMDKTWFALLHDSEIQATLNLSERALVARYIPYTRALRPADLAEVVSRKNRYIFKKRDSFGGGGICIGAETTAAELRALLAGESCRAWIAQNFMALDPMSFPGDGDFRPTPHHVVFGLYIYGDRTNGVLVRASACSKIVNVTIGNAALAWAFCVDAARKVGMTSGLIEERV